MCFKKNLLHQKIFYNSQMDPLESNNGGDHWGLNDFQIVFVINNDVHFTRKNSFVREKLDLM